MCHLFANGDIADRETAQLALQQSALMGLCWVGRHMASPWLPGLVAGTISLQQAEQEKYDAMVAIRHHSAILQFYGIENGIRQARKHLGWYIDNLELDDGTAALRRHILTSFNVEEIRDSLLELYDLASQSHKPLTLTETQSAA